MDEQGIHRDEVIAIVTAPMSIHADTGRILELLEGEEDERLP